MLRPQKTTTTTTHRGETTPMPEHNPHAIENITRILEGFGVTTNVETHAHNLLSLGSVQLVIEMLHEFYKRAQARADGRGPAGLFLHILEAEGFLWLERRRREAEAP